MTLNVNNNSPALAALAALNRTTDDLAATQARVSSGLKVAAAKDNAAVFSIAQSQRTDISALATVSDGLSRAQSIADVAGAAGSAIGDLLNSLKTKALNAIDPTLDATSRAALSTDFQTTLTQVQQAIGSASFGGANLLNGSLPNGIQFIASADASSTITLSGVNLSLGGSTVTLPSTASVSTVTAATTALGQLATSISNLNASLAAIGSQASQIQAHASFVNTLSTAVTVGVGKLVDSDTAAESARLTALQVQQQLGAQSLSIANQQPSLILSLFHANG